MDSDLFGTAKSRNSVVGETRKVMVRERIFERLRAGCGGLNAELKTNVFGLAAAELELTRLRP
jgi:hypothetical protein